MPCEGMPFILVIGAHTQCEFLMDEKAPLLHLPWQHDKKLTFSYCARIDSYAPTKNNYQSCYKKSNPS